MFFSSFSKLNFVRIRQQTFHCPQVAKIIACYPFCIIRDNTADYCHLFVSIVFKSLQMSKSFFGGGNLLVLLNISIEILMTNTRI